MAKAITEVGKIKASKMIAADEGAYRFKPVHPELSRDYYFQTEEAALAKLDSFCAEYDIDRVVGSVALYIRTERMVREFVSHRQMQMGAPMMAQTMVKRAVYLEVK